MASTTTGARAREAPGGGPEDLEDFEGLYRRWWPEVVALCRQALGRADDAEDAAQEAFLRAWQARDSYSAAEPYWPWLATIARRLCVDRRRRARPPAPGEPLPAVLTPERVVVAAADLRVVLEAVGALGARERRALVLRELAGWPYRRIAEVEGTTVEAVRGSLKRARAALRRSVLHDDVFDAPPRGLREGRVRAEDRTTDKRRSQNRAPLTL